MRKKITYLLTILTLILAIVFILTNMSFADNYSLKAFDNGENSVPTSIKNLTNNSLGTAISIVRTVGVGIALIIITVIAMKYMMAAPSDRADIKKHAVPFLIGACALFATSGIIGIIASFADTISI